MGNDEEFLLYLKTDILNVFFILTSICIGAILMNKFKNVPIEEDTRIIFQQEMKFGEYDVLYQTWTWDGISAESIIFSSEDIPELKDQEIEKQVRASPICKKGSSITIKRTDSGYTFINFNFET